MGEREPARGGALTSLGGGWNTGGGGNDGGAWSESIDWSGVMTL